MMLCDIVFSGFCVRLLFGFYGTIYFVCDFAKLRTNMIIFTSVCSSVPSLIYLTARKYGISSGQVSINYIIQILFFLVEN